MRLRILHITLLLYIVLIGNNTLSLANPKGPCCSNLDINHIKFSSISFVIFSPPETSFYIRPHRPLRIFSAPPLLSSPSPLPAQRLINELEQFQQRKDCLHSMHRYQLGDLDSLPYRTPQFNAFNEFNEYNEFNGCASYKPFDRELTLRNASCSTFSSIPSPFNLHPSSLMQYLPSFSSLSSVSSFATQQLAEHLPSFEWKHFVALRLIRLVAFEYLNDGLQLSLSAADKASTLMTRSWTECVRRMGEVYDTLSVRRLFQSMSLITNQCFRITPYLCRILPSPISSDVTSVQQMCAIVVVGGTVFGLLLGVFLAAWCRYQNMINEFYTNQSA